MPLVRTFAIVGADGKISLPANVRQMMGLEAGERVEIRLQGPNQRPSIVIRTLANRYARAKTVPPAIPVAHH